MMSSMRDLIDRVMNTDPAVIIFILVCVSMMMTCIMAFVVRSIEKDVQAMESVIEHMMDLPGEKKRKEVKSSEVFE